MNTQAMHAWQFLYPPVQHHAHGWLDVGDGHELYWETSGNPLGMPALFVHGGPGAGCTADDRRWFDPRRYRIVLFDQRGAGRSRPPGRLVDNDTAHLLADIEALRHHLQVDRWLLFGGSWGATLALAYAQCHPERVRALVLRGVFTATAAERRWLYTAHGAALFQRCAWRRFNAVFGALQSANLLDACAAQLHCGEAAVERVAAQAWLRWERDLMDCEAAPSPLPKPGPPRDDAAALAMARIGVHYARHAFFLDEGQLLARAGRLHGLPGVIVQGLRDRVTPPALARALHRGWPGATLHPVRAGGHASSHPEMARQLIAATDLFGAADPGVRPLAAAAGNGAGSRRKEHKTLENRRDPRGPQTSTPGDSNERWQRRQATEPRGARSLRRAGQSGREPT